MAFVSQLQTGHVTLGKLPGLSSEDSREGNSPDPAGLWCGLSRPHIGRSAQQGSSSTPHSCQQHPSLWRGRESPLRTPVSRLANCRSADKVPGLGHLCALSPAGAGHAHTDSVIWASTRKRASQVTWLQRLRPVLVGRVALLIQPGRLWSDPGKAVA